MRKSCRGSLIFIGVKNSADFQISTQAKLQVKGISRPKILLLMKLAHHLDLESE